MAALPCQAVLEITGRVGATPFRLSYVFGLWLNWPLLTFLVLVASTALAIDQSWRRLLALALDRAKVSPSLRRPGSRRPVLIHLHPIFGSKRLGTRYLFHRLAGEGWTCVGANYRRASDDEFSDPLIDVKKVIAWMREHGPEYGADPTAIFVAGSSLGGHLAALAACMPCDPMLQPGFESADTSVAGIISLYGYYGDVAPGGPPTSRLPYTTTNAPPCFVAHGDRDTLVIVEDARGFVEQLRATSSNPVVYAELPGAQHGFDLFRSRRFDTVVDAIEAFALFIASAGSPRPTRSRSDDAYPISGSVRAGREGR